MPRAGRERHFFHPQQQMGRRSQPDREGKQGIILRSGITGIEKPIRQRDLKAGIIRLIPVRCTEAEFDQPCGPVRKVPGSSSDQFGIIQTLDLQHLFRTSGRIRNQLCGRLAVITAMALFLGNISMNGPLGIRIFPRLRSTRLGPYPAAVHNNQAAVVFMLPQGNKDTVFVQLHHFALVFAAVFRTIQRSIAGMVAVFVQDNLPESVPGFTLVPGHGNVVESRFVNTSSHVPLPAVAFSGRAIVFVHRETMVPSSRRPNVFMVRVPKKREGSGLLHVSP